MRFSALDRPSAYNAQPAGSGTRMTELWLVDLEAAAPALEALERDCPRLAGDDRARALRLGEARARRHRLAAYTALRIVLERVAGPEVRGQTFARASGGRPGLGAGDTTFSLSHTEGLALIGVARAGSIGVDLERVRALRMSSRRREEMLALAAGLAAEPLGDPAGDAALLRAWCRVEAFAKARGEGLDRLLRELGLREAGGRRLSVRQIAADARHLARQSGLRIADVTLPPGLYGAVATAGAAPSARPRRLPADPQALRRLAAGQP
jgi:4'-phosphopantetheinyl transferase